MDLGVRDRRVLITGGTRGIGKAIALIFAKEGAAVGICARDQKAVKATVSELAELGGRCWGQAVDVADSEALSSWVEAGVQGLGGLDTLVTNASAMAAGATPRDFRLAFDVDLMQTIVAANAALPYLERSANGNIVAISSVSGSEDYGFEEAAYSTMKAALNFYVKMLARHIAPKNVRANTVSPGNTYFEGGFWQRLEKEQPKTFDTFLKNNPTGRMASVEDIANAVLFLSSAAATYISGANIVVDGTLTRRVQN